MTPGQWFWSVVLVVFWGLLLLAMVAGSAFVAAGGPM